MRKKKLKMPKDKDASKPMPPAAPSNQASTMASGTTVNKSSTKLTASARLLFKWVLKGLRFLLRFIVPNGASFGDIWKGLLKALPTVLSTVCLGLAWYLQTVEMDRVQGRIDRINELREFFAREKETFRTCQMNVFNMDRYSQDFRDTLGRLNYLGSITEAAFSTARLIDIGQKLHMGKRDFIPYEIYDSASVANGNPILLKSYDSASLYLEDSVIYSYRRVQDIDSAMKNLNRLKKLSTVRDQSDQQAGLAYLKEKVASKDRLQWWFLVLTCAGVSLISIDKIKKHIAEV